MRTPFGLLTSLEFDAGFVFFCLVDGVYIKSEQQRAHLLPFSIVLWDSKTKSKPSGLPDSNFIFFIATKQTKQKKTYAALGMSCS